MLLTGLACFPLANQIFYKFEDRGWLFSKTIGLFLSSWILWLANSSGVLVFTQHNGFLVLILLAAACYGIFAALMKLGLVRTEIFGGLLKAGKLVIAEEAIFLFLFALSVYIVGFRPEAYGTEKFMDYAFMTSMMRSLNMPFADPWYAGEPINYYYGGQYVASFLTKLTGAAAGEGYNLMRALITSFSFVLPFSLTFQLMHDRLKEAGKHRAAPFFAGLLGGTAVAFSGNFHYVIYGIILPVINKIKGIPYSYWFPDSTRYIGYDPDLPDKTIHEFPAYSTVLGDLHAHYINIMFAVTVTAIVYGWAKKQDPRREERFPYLRTEIVLIGIMTGLFRWMNYWDFPIYYVVCGSIFFFVLLRTYRDSLLRFLLIMLGIAAVMFISGYLAALPFIRSFLKISSEIGFTHSHTQFYQLLVLWGLPAACLAGFILQLIAVHRRMKKETPPVLRRARRMPLPDLAILMYGLCAAGLVFLPEVIYVKDIYGGDHYRANTMFKLTYQAFILFGICMAYILVRAVVLGFDRKAACAAAVPEEAESAERAVPEEAEFPAAAVLEEAESVDEAAAEEVELTDKEAAEEGELPGAAPAKKRKLPAGAVLQIVLGMTGLVLLLLTAGYIFQSVHDWFGNIFDPSLRVHTDASVFVSEYFPSDFEAVNYLNGEVGGQPVILEAPGDSYSDYERISVATGLPTVAGWWVHEWLWRQNRPELDDRIRDCETIYTSADESEVRSLIEKYGIEYIYVGDLEREKYADINEPLLKGLGDMVFTDEDGTYIIAVNEAAGQR